MRNRNNFKNGYTLVEIMVAIVIIGILASIIAFQYTKIRDDVRAKACQANMKRIYEAAQEYMIDNKGNPETFHKITNTILFKAGYLKYRPKCPVPSNGYAVSGEEEDKIQVSCFNPTNYRAGHGKFILNDK